MPAREKLVVIDPEAPKGFRRISYGPVVNGRPLRSPAMRRLVQSLVRDQMAYAERERQEAAWVERHMAAAPPLTDYQRQVLRRVKQDLMRIARKDTDAAA